ncbi:MAG: WYL domain-containing protein [Flavobacteriales bacterium]|nr:WYL domain-containing protein [Flavobacteriales bacterium]
MPANKFALLRYRIIDRSIRNRGSKAYPSKEDLRYACEEALYGSDGEHISMSTIDKDIWAMRNEGELGYYAPIKFSKDHGGYFYEDPEYTIAELPLNEDDLSAIRAAAETLFQFREIPLFKQFDSAIEKILDRMKISAGDVEKKENEVIQFEKLGSYKGSEFLSNLFDACTHKKVTSITYQKFQTEEVKSYTFHPYILKEYRSRWYVIGYDINTQTHKTFALDRIKKVVVGEHKFVVDAAFDSKSFFEYALGITVTNDQPQEIVLEFQPNLAPYVQSQPIHHSQKIIEQSNSYSRVSIKVIVTVELITTILGFGDGVKVLSPSALKEQVKRTLNSCISQY